MNFLWLVPLIKGKTQSQQLEMRGLWLQQGLQRVAWARGMCTQHGEMGHCWVQNRILVPQLQVWKRVILYVNFNYFCQALTQIANHASGFPLLCREVTNWGCLWATWENMRATPRCSGSRVGSGSEGCMGKGLKTGQKHEWFREKCWRGKELVSERQSRYVSMGYSLTH